MPSRISSNLWHRILLMVVVIASLAQPAAAQKCWSATGSTAVVRATSLDFVTQTSVNLGIVGTAPLPAVVHARYDVSGILDDTGSVLNGKALFVRYIDNGPEARVRIYLKQMEIVNMSILDVLVFDSDLYPQSPSAQLRGLGTACVYGGGFISPDYDYFLSVELTKSGSGGTPFLQVVQVCEGAGLYC